MAKKAMVEKQKEHQSIQQEHIQDVKYAEDLMLT